MDYLTSEVYQYTKKLIEDINLRERFGMNALTTARSKFSPDNRNKIMKNIYSNAIR